MTNEELETLCRDRKAAAELRDLADGEVKKLSATIGLELADRGVRSVELQDFIPRVVEQTRKTIDKVKLVELGVPMATIEAATVIHDTTFVRVDQRKAKADLKTGAGLKAVPAQKIA